MISHSEVPPAPAPRPATQITRPAATGDTVTVACKLPSGLILRVFRQEEAQEPQRDGSLKTVMVSVPIPELQFTVRGTWVASAGQAYNPRNPAVAELLPGGYALTQGVPKEIWDRWYEQNRHSAMVRNKIVFAHASHSTVNEEAGKLREVQSGMEPIDRAKPGERLPGGIDRRLRLAEFDAGGEGTLPR